MIVAVRLFVGAIIVAIRLLVASISRILAFNAAISIILALSFVGVFLLRATGATAWRVGDHVVVRLELARRTLGAGADVLVTRLSQGLLRAVVDVIR